MDCFCGLPQAAVGEGVMWLVQVNEGSWKVMLLAVFLKPPGMGEVETVRVSMCE